MTICFLLKNLLSAKYFFFEYIFACWIILVIQWLKWCCLILIFSLIYFSVLSFHLFDCILPFARLFINPVNRNFSSISSLMDSGRCNTIFAQHIFQWKSEIHPLSDHINRKFVIQVIFSKIPTYARSVRLVRGEVVETFRVIKFFCSVRDCWASIRLESF